MITFRFYSPTSGYDIAAFKACTSTNNENCALSALCDREARRTGIKPFTGRQTPVGRTDNSIYKK